MSTSTTRAPKKAFLSKDLGLFLAADVEAITATQGQVDTLVALGSHDLLDEEQIKHYLTGFEARVKRAKLLTDASLRTAKSQRKFILTYALGVTKHQKADQEKWSRENSIKSLKDCAVKTGSLSALYRELRATLSAEGGDDPTDADKLNKALAKFKEAGHSKAEVLKLVEALFK